MIVRVFLLFAALGITGCAATGETYSTDVLSRAAVQPEASRLTVLREGYTQYSARSVRVSLDGKPIGSVDHKGFNIFDVAPGLHTLAADMWDSPGKCEVALDLKPAETYYFAIQPRTGNLVSGLALGLAGMAIESAGKVCGGAFAINPVTKESAEQALPPLRLSK